MGRWRSVPFFVVALALAATAFCQEFETEAVGPGCEPTETVGDRAWEIGRFYRNVDTGNVIEVIAEVCLGYEDASVDPLFRQCYDRRVAARNVVGRGLPSEPRRLVVYLDARTESLMYANIFIPYPSVVGRYAPLPSTCYARSRAVSISHGYFITY